MDDGRFDIPADLIGAVGEATTLNVTRYLRAYPVAASGRLVSVQFWDGATVDGLSPQQ